VKPWRRLITVPVVFLAWVLWLGALPLLLVMALLVDALRRSRGVAFRSVALAAAYLTCEVVGVTASGALWVWRGVARVDEDRWVDMHFRLEAWWGATLFGSVVRLFGLRVEVEGEADLGRGPYLLLVRHASMADTLLASRSLRGISGPATASSSIRKARASRPKSASGFWTGSVGEATPRRSATRSP
jgi:hypothetical protein